MSVENLYTEKVLLLSSFVKYFSMKYLCSLSVLVSSLTGSHLLAVSRNMGCRCLAVASNKKVLLYQWTSPDVRKQSKIINYFLLIKEVVVIESPSLMTLVDCGKDGYSVCVGYRNQFDLIDMTSGKIAKVHDTDATSSKVCRINVTS